MKECFKTFCLLNKTQDRAANQNTALHTRLKGTVTKAMFARDGFFDQWMFCWILLYSIKWYSRAFLQLISVPVRITQDHKHTWNFFSDHFLVVFLQRILLDIQNSLWETLGGNGIRLLFYRVTSLLHVCMSVVSMCFFYTEHNVTQIFKPAIHLGAKQELRQYQHLRRTGGSKWWSCHHHHQAAYSPATSMVLTLQPHSMWRCSVISNRLTPLVSDYKN